jgi:sulfite reductase (ferredoxin)
MLILDVKPNAVVALVTGLAGLGLDANPTEFRRGAMACTGIEFCKLAIVETKALAANLVEDLENRLPTFDNPLSIHVNGCPNSCARIQVADIGLRGSIVRDSAGEQVEGFQVHLGGGLGLDTGLGRKPRGLKVPSTELPEFVARVAARYDAQHKPDESFAAWAQRADEEDLK